MSSVNKIIGVFNQLLQECQLLPIKIILLILGFKLAARYIWPNVNFWELFTDIWEAIVDLWALHNVVPVMPPIVPDFAPEAMAEEVQRAISVSPQVAKSGSISPIYNSDVDVEENSSSDEDYDFFFGTPPRTPPKTPPTPRFLRK